MTEKYILDENDLPKKWFNILPKLPEPLAPPLHPATKQPISPDDLKPLFPMELIRQEMSDEPYIDIPEEVRDTLLQVGRPTPLYRAVRLEKFLKTPAKIFYKREDVSFVGSHKPNTAIPQAYFNAKEGVERLTTETGAGQWGCALSLGCRLFGMDCLVYMVKVSYQQKPYRGILMETYGSKVIPSPSTTTEAGKKALAENNDHPGSLGLAISEAIEVAAKDGNTKYSLGSVLNHVMLHQTVVGQETLAQLEMADVKPDVMIGCVGGGSNFAGFTFPAVERKLSGKMKDLRIVAIEPRSCATLTTGEYRYDFGDAVGMTPLLLMYTLGHEFVPSPIHAGGLRYHGAAPTVCNLIKNKVVEAKAYDQLTTFEAGVTFTRTEGLLPAPETNHAIKAAIDEALEAKRKNEKRVIVFNFSGHGLLDLNGYKDFNAGKLKT